MNGMVPSGSALQGPNFSRGKPRLGADSAVVCFECPSCIAVDNAAAAAVIIGLDTPAKDTLTVPQVGGDGIILVLAPVVIKSERAKTRCRRQDGIRNQRGSWIGSQIDALVRVRRGTQNLKAQECADGWIACPGEGLGDGYDIPGFTAVLVHLQVDQVHGLPGTVAGEINDDVIPLGDAKLVRPGQRHGDRQQVAVIGYLNELRAIAQ